MIEKCANPLCSAPFRRLGRGRLFAFEPGPVAGSPRNARFSESAKAAGTALFLWLCETCSLTNTLGLDATGRVTIRRLPERGDSAFVDRAVPYHASQFPSR